MFVDTHCHLNFDRFDGDRDAVVQRAQDAGVGVIVNPGIDLETSRQAIELAERYPGVFACVGIHPNDTSNFDDQVLAALRALATHPKVVAIGEIGLDYYWERSPHDRQQAALQAQLELAADLDLPVVLHCRDAHDDLREQLRKWVSGARKRRGADAILGVLHAYSGGLDLAQEAFGWDMVVGLGGPVTFQNARDLHALVAQLPLEKLLLETDAPFLSPHPFRGKRNEPARIPLIAQAIARLHGVDEDVVARQTTELAERIFGVLRRATDRSQAG